MYPGWTPFRALGFTKNFWDFVEAHDFALSLDFKYFVAGRKAILLLRLGFPFCSFWH